MTTIIAIILGAFFNRVRGGMADAIWLDNKVPNIVWKLINALAFGIFCAVISHNYYVVLTAAAGMFTGAIWHWGEWLNGLVARKNVKDNLLMTAFRGMLWTAIIAAWLMPFNPLVGYIIPVGALFGLCYYGSTYLTKSEERAWAYGEYIWGGIMWGAVSLCLSQ